MAEIPDIEDLSNPLLTDELTNDLKRQAYKVVGSHSAVKLCDWTKKYLLDGSYCYKQQFYNIGTGKCMQMSTNAACSNRCVFCWRHQRTPIYQDEWKWDMDNAEDLLTQCLKAQHHLIKERQGIAGVDMGRLTDSLDIKHCALSLVGEPLLYPEVNTFINQLHGMGISTFLVTNGQHPQAIADLTPVTQLYLSVDASNSQALKAIDRPVYKDYWERLLASLDILSARPERTVIRLTCVRHMNIEPRFLEEYGELINRGRPDFIELKGLSYVGHARDALEWENVTSISQLCEMTKRLLPFIPEYELISVHPRSRAVCLARKTMYRDGKWQAFIDFDEFFSVVSDGTIEKGTYDCPIAEEYVHDMEHFEELKKTDVPTLKGKADIYGESQDDLIQ
ncbi:hypothetical protein PCE1_002897 [Barthelona sp. PCE]